MGVTSAGYIGTQIDPSGLGLRFYKVLTAVGDASAGDIWFQFQYKAWRDSWVVVDRVWVRTDNANTDAATILGQYDNFTDPVGFPTTFACGVMTSKSTVGGVTQYYLIPEMPIPVYLGRFDNAAGTDVMISGYVNPNTDTKNYACVVAGRIYYYQPDIRRL